MRPENTSLEPLALMDKIINLNIYLDSSGAILS